MGGFAVVDFFVLVLTCCVIVLGDSDPHSGYAAAVLSPQAGKNDLDLKESKTRRAAPLRNASLIRCDVSSDCAEIHTGEDDRGKRVKRKVIPRGTHYIVSSKHSPYTSSSRHSNSFGSDSRNQNRNTGHTYAPDGTLQPVSKIFSNSDYDNRYSSNSLRSYTRPIANRSSGSQKPERQILNRGMKEEIARYALKHGAHRTVKRYETDLGRRLKERVVAKFIRMYQKRMGNKGRHRRKQKSP